MLWLRRGLTIVNKSSSIQTAYAIYRAVIQSFLTACVQFRRYVAKLSMNSTANGSSESWSCFDQLNSTAWKIGGTVTYCLFIIVSLAANSLIVMIVYKTPNLKCYYDENFCFCFRVFLTEIFCICSKLYK